MISTRSHVKNHNHDVERYWSKETGFSSTLADKIVNPQNVMHKVFKSFFTNILHEPWVMSQRIERSVTQLTVNTPSVKNLVSLTRPPFLRAYTRRVGNLETLERVYYEPIGGESHEFWSVVQKFDHPDRKKIIHSQTELYKAFPNKNFEFHLVPLDARDPMERIPDSATCIFQKESATAA